MFASTNVFFGVLRRFGLTFTDPHISDHLAKFHGDRQRELKDITLQSARNKHQQ